MVFSRLGASFALVAGAFVAGYQTPVHADAVPGEYIVEFRHGRFPVAAASRAGTGSPAGLAELPTGATVRDRVGSRSVVVSAPQFPPLAATTSGAGGPRAAASQRDTFCDQLPKEVVAACSPNYLVSIDRSTNDPLLGDLWGLSSAGIDARRGWDIATDSRATVVAVVDTGVDYRHTDLAPNMWRNPGEVPGNGIDDDGNGFIDDIHGADTRSNDGDPLDDNSHGTHVAGTIGAVGDNSSGVVGVSWRANIMALKFLDGSGSGTLADAIEALEYVLTMKARGVDVRVINASWGGGGFSAPLFNVIGRLRDAGIIFVAAAGNEQNDNDALPSYPASYDLDNVVAVAALTRAQNLADFSNYGATSVDIAAPGDDIVSTVPGNNYASFSGTSMAAPHVSGALTLLTASLPGEAPGALLNRLYASGVDLPALNGLVSTGRALNLGRLLRGETTTVPVPDPSTESCTYDVVESSSGRDRSADAAPIVQQSDELEFVRIALPFDFPFHRESVSTITISPNGVVYMGSVEDRLDFASGSTAPMRSIAALHTDLVTRGSGTGVRVAVAPDRVTIRWVADIFGWSSDHVEVTLSLFSDGTVRTSLDFATPTVEGLARAGAVMGLRGTSPGSAVTFATGGSKIRDGLEVTYTPRCDGTVPVRVTSLHLSGTKDAKRSNRLVAGGRFVLDIRTNTADVDVPLGLVLNGVACTVTPRTLNVSGRSSTVRGSTRHLVGRAKIARLGFYSAAAVKERPVIHTARLDTRARVKKLSRNSLCRAIMRTLRTVK